MNDTFEVWLPGYFWSDHRDRDWECGEELKWSKNKKRVLVRINEKQLNEIYEDAAQYVDGMGWDPEIVRTVRRWAISMVKAIDRIRADRLSLK